MQVAIIWEAFESSGAYALPQTNEITSSEGGTKASELVLSSQVWVQCSAKVKEMYSIHP